MKILITGITGFVGSEIARALVTLGNFEVGGLVRTASNKKQTETIRDIADNVALFFANLTDYHAVKNVVRTLKPQYIVHVGALTPVRYSFEMPHEYNEVNYLGTINLVHAALEVPDFKKFIFASTMETYGWQEKHEPFVEDMILHPASPYAVSKVAAEKYLEMAGRAYGLPYLISRACNTYGKKYNAGLIIEYMVTTMLRGEDLYIGTPEAARDFLFIDDHVHAYRALITTAKKNATYNFGTGSAIRMADLAEMLKKKIGYKGKIIHHFPPDYPSRPVTEEYLSLNAARAQKELGWKPLVPFDEGLDRTIAYWKEHVS